MRFLISVACGVSIGCVSQWAAAGTRLPIDHPTPPECAADGTCYPKTGEWGWYQVKWRQWPGVALEPTAASQGPGPTPATGGGELGPSEPPTPEQEDVQAPPPSSTKKKTEPGEKPAVEGTPNTTPPGLPPLPPYQSSPATPSGPATPGGPTAPKTSPTGDLDPPPELPFAISPGKAIPKNSRGASTSGPRLNSSGAASTNDPPPSPPWSFRSAAL